MGLRYSAIRRLVNAGRPGVAARLAPWLLPELRPGPAPSGRRVHVFDWGLCEAVGHYLNFDLAITRAVQRNPGWSCVCYGQLDLSPEVRASLPTQPFFVKGGARAPGDRATRSDPQTRDDADAGGSSGDARSRSWAEFNRRRLTQLGRRIARDDVVVFHSFRPSARGSVGYIGPWLRSRAGDGAPVAVVYFMFGDYETEAGEALRPEYAELLEALAAYPADRLFAIAETPEIRDDLRRLSGLPVETAPHFKPDALREAARARAPRREGDPVRVGFAGHSHRERGAHLLPELVRSVPERASRAVRFRIHLQEGSRGVIDPEDLRSLPGVELREGFLEVDDYYAFLAGMDVMALPFEPGPRTSTQGSGLFWESLALGLVMVLPHDSHMAREAARLDAGYTTYKDWNATALADAVLEATGNHPALAPRARAAAERWRDERGLPAFMERVLAR